MRGSKPTWLSPLPPPSGLISVPGRIRGSGGGFLDFFPEPPEDPVDPEAGGGGTEVGVCCDIAETTLVTVVGNKRGNVNLLEESTRLGYVLEDSDGIAVSRCWHRCPVEGRGRTFNRHWSPESWTFSRISERF